MTFESQLWEYIHKKWNQDTEKVSAPMFTAALLTSEMWCVYIYIYIYTHIYTHTHTQTKE